MLLEVYEVGIKGYSFVMIHCQAFKLLSNEYESDFSVINMWCTGFIVAPE